MLCSTISSSSLFTSNNSVQWWYATSRPNFDAVPEICNENMNMTNIYSHRFVLVILIITIIINLIHKLVI